MTRAWGLSPATALIQTVGSASSPPKSEVTLNIGSATFAGIVTNSVENRSAGVMTDITVTDNRIKLGWDTVFCYFNGVEIIEDDPATPGIDRRRRYWHIMPEDWHSQSRIYTNEPYTCEQIINFLLESDQITNDWSLDVHERLEKPFINLDCLNGKKFGTLLQEICDSIGLLLGLEDENTLIFAVKGVGEVPVTSSLYSYDVEEGSALGPDTKVQVVGDSNIYQDVPIDLEPDWNRSYEQYLFQGEWREEVKSTFEISNVAEASARANEITLREYATRKNSAALVDFGKWGEVSRMEIPVWVYIRDIVFKAYRVPRDYTINGVPLSSLRMREGLLAAVESNEEGGMQYKPESEGEIYPDTKAYCIVKGAPLSMIDLRQNDVIKPETFAAAAEKWQPYNRFNLDTKNNVIVFEDAIVIPGSGDGALYVQPNLEESGVSDAVMNIVVPNAAATYTPADVRASLCFEAEKFSALYGSGERLSSAYVPGLNFHALLFNGVWEAEIKYENDQGVQEIADIIGPSILTEQDVLKSGSFTNHGVAGATLNGAIDRITTVLSFEDGGEREGITETISYAKELNPSSFVSERELERRARMRDLFPGQSELREEARRIRLLARLQKENKRTGKHAIESIDDLYTKIPGNVDGNPNFVRLDSPFSYPVGMPVFVDDTGLIDASSKRFGGILSTANGPAVIGSAVPTITQGVVPTRVQGPVEAGDSVYVSVGENYAKSSGDVLIGTVQSAYSGSGIILIPLRLGASGGVAKKFLELFQTTTGVGENPPPRVGVMPGTIRGAYPTGMSPSGDPVFLLVPETGQRFVYGKLIINGSNGTVTGRQIIQSSTIPEDMVDTDTEFHILIGVYTYDAEAGFTEMDNSCYGPIDATICKLWYTAEAPFYGVTLTGK